MVNTEKIKLMVEAESYRQKDYAKDIFVHRFYKNDYLGMERLKNVVWLTLFYALYLAFVVVRDFYVNNADMLHFDYQGFVLKALVIYLLMVVGVCVLTTMFAGRRYDRAKERVDRYCELADAIADFDEPEEEE